MNPSLVSLWVAAPRETRSDIRYYWDGRRRGKNRFCIFQYTWKGEGVYNDGKQEIPIPEGHALFTTSVEPSAYYYPPGAREPWEFGWMDIAGAEDSWKWLRQNFGSVIPLDPKGEAITVFQDIARLYSTRTFQDRFQASELVFRFLMEVFRELTLSPRRKVSSIHYARHYIDNHHQRSLGMKELAARVGMSREHFSRVFRATIGQGPGAYMRERRLQNAELLLVQSSETVATISRLSGFTSASHFCRAFRARHKCSPEVFRARR